MTLKKKNLPPKIQGGAYVWWPSIFLCPIILSANKQILNSHITCCPKITVLKNPQAAGGGFLYLAHGLLCNGTTLADLRSSEKNNVFLFLNQKYAWLFHLLWHDKGRAYICKISITFLCYCMFVCLLRFCSHALIFLDIHFLHYFYQIHVLLYGSYFYYHYYSY